MTARAALALAFGLLAPAPAVAQPARHECMPKDLAALDGWNGVWLLEGIAVDINGREPAGAPPMVVAMKFFGIEAPWNDRGWLRFAAYGQRMGGKAINRGWGFPMMMSAPAPFKIVISPRETVITSQYRDIRYIPTDGRARLPEDERWPTPWGESIGCWVGDTLVIETLDAAHTPEFNPYAAPLSDGASFVERLRLAAPDRLEAEITVTDPETLDEPWIVHLAYLRHPRLDRLSHEGDVLENDRFSVADGTLDIASVGAQPDLGGPSREAVRLSAVELDRLAGTYAIDGTPLEFATERRRGWLYARDARAQLFFMPLRAVGPLEFVALDGRTIRFFTDSSGNVTRVEGVLADGTPFTGKRKGD